MEGQSTTTPETRFAERLELQKSIFGEMIENMYEGSPENQNKTKSERKDK